MCSRIPHTPTQRSRKAAGTANQQLNSHHHTRWRSYPHPQYPACNSQFFQQDNEGSGQVREGCPTVMLSLVLVMCIFHVVVQLEAAATRRLLNLLNFVHHRYAQAQSDTCKYDFPSFMTNCFVLTLQCVRISKVVVCTCKPFAVANSTGD